uniref:Uncharacterized protein n=1 Tax=Phenylobacterium glaciei TaxID=2803784 RepID=A0A974P4Q9_9CAUL|nr:hypothetical protein JKL49_08760 [Phenylobacterium glaciei]
MVGAATVTPETPAARLRPGRAAVVVSARRLDGGFLHEVDDNLHVTQSRISPPGVLRIRPACPWWT